MFSYILSHRMYFNHIVASDVNGPWIPTDAHLRRRATLGRARRRFEAQAKAAQWWRASHLVIVCRARTDAPGLRRLHADAPALIMVYQQK